MVNRKRNRTESEKESGQQKIKMERRRSSTRKIKQILRERDWSSKKEKKMREWSTQQEREKSERERDSIEYEQRVHNKYEHIVLVKAHLIIKTTPYCTSGIQLVIPYNVVHM